MADTNNGNALRMAPPVRSAFGRFVDDLNRRRAGIRDTVAYAINNPGEGAEGDREAHGLHQVYAKGLTKSVGRYLPNALAAPLVDYAGLANESVSGALSAIGGHGFYGDKGYDQGDIEANRRGIREAVPDANRYLGAGHLLGLAAGVPPWLLGQTQTR